jgi:glc operon protein GlcG
MPLQLTYKKSLTLDLAKHIAAAAHAEAARNGWNMFIAILDDGGNVMYVERMDGAQLGSFDVSIAKGRCAVHFKRPTKAMEDVVAGGRVVVMTLPGAIPVEGGLPLMAEGQLVGGIGVSGGTSPQDGLVAAAAQAALDAALKG